MKRIATSPSSTTLRARITKLEKTNERLNKEILRFKESENIYRTIFENTGTITLIYNEKTIITMVNSDFARRMGFSKSEVEGKRSWTEFIAPDDLPRLLFLHQLRGKDPKAAPRAYEFKIITRQGEMLHIFATIDMIPGTTLRVASLIDITDRVRAESEIIRISGAERQKIGQDLHDDLAPHLIGIEVLVKILEDKIKSADPKDSALISRIRVLIQDAVEKTRRFAHGLCPVFLVEHGFESALRELVSTTEEIYGIRCNLSFNDCIPSFDISTATNIYYIVQEAIHNSIKHGKSKIVTIEIQSSGETIIITVRDNGSGYDNNRKSPGIGQNIMRYRARTMGAGLDIQSTRNRGTTVRLILPLKQNQCKDRSQ